MGIGAEPEGEPTVDDLTIVAVKSDECDEVMPTFDEWVAHGKTIPADMVFAGGSPWFDEATGKNKSDEEVYELIYGDDKSAKVLSESLFQSQTEEVQIEGDEFVISNRGGAHCGFCTQHTEVHYSLCWGLCSGVVPQEITDRWVPYLQSCTAAAIKKVAALKANHDSS